MSPLAHATCAETWGFQPALPFALIALLACAALIAPLRAALARRAHASLLALRVAGVLGVSTLLCTPGTWTSPTDPAPAPLTVLIDASRSMATPADANDPCLTRLDALRHSWLIPGALTVPAEPVPPSFFTFGDSFAPINPQDLATLAPAADHTRLWDALRTAIDSLPRQPIPEPGSPRAPRPVAADLLILTDGRDTAGPLPTDLVSLLDSRAVRLSAVCVGSPDDAPDLRVDLDAPPGLAHESSPVALRLRVRSRGYDAQPATITITDQHQRIAATVPLTLARLIEQDVLITPAPDPTADPTSDPARGPAASPVRTLIYTAHAQPMPAESSRDNNASSCVVRVAPPLIRVLLLEGRPSWRTRFFIDALADDLAIQSTSALALAPSRAPDQPPLVRVTRSRPTPTGARIDSSTTELLTADDLNNTDILVLGHDVQQLDLPIAADDIADFVRRRAGRLLLLSPPARAGQLVQQVADLLALDQDADLSADPVSLALTQRVGLGRVAILQDATLWRQRLRHPPGNDPAAPAWRAAITRLFDPARDPLMPDLLLSAQPTTLAQGDTITITLRARDPAFVPPPGSLRLIDPLGNQVALPALQRDTPIPSPAPGPTSRWTTTAVPHTDGVYHLTFTQPQEPRQPPVPDPTALVATTAFVVKSPDVETQDLAPDPAPLQDVAQATGGRLYSLTQSALFASDRQQHAQSAHTPPVFSPAAMSPWVLLPLALTFIAEWALRRRKGMP